MLWVGDAGVNGHKESKSWYFLPLYELELLYPFFGRMMLV